MNVPIGGVASVNVAIGRETSVTVAAVDNKPLSALRDAVSAPCNQATVRDVGLLDYLTIL